jgi:hypothetical protein
MTVHKGRCIRPEGVYFEGDGEPLGPKLVLDQMREDVPVQPADCVRAV